MATSIGKLAYVATWDATNLTKGIMSSRQAFAAHKKIVQESQSPLDRYSTGLANLQMLVARHPDMLSKQSEIQADLQRTYLKEEQSLRKLTDAEAARLRTLTASERAAELAAASEKRLTRARSEAASVIDANRTAGERYSRGLAKHNSLLRKGLIDQRTHARAVRGLRADYVAGIPVVGQFASSLVDPRMAAAAVTLGGIAYAVRQISSEMANLDDIAKRSARLDMDPSSFLVMSKAASHAGIEADRLFDSIGKLEKRIGEAGMGSSEAAFAFERLQLDFTKLSQMSPEDAFMQVGNALQSVENNTERLAIANKIFEESGRELITMLGLTRQEFDALQRSMELRGEIFSKSELARVEAANDALADLNATWRAMWQGAAVELAPAIKMLSTLAVRVVEVSTMIAELSAKSNRLAQAATLMLGGPRAVPGLLMQATGFGESPQLPDAMGSSVVPDASLLPSPAGIGPLPNNSADSTPAPAARQSRVEQQLNREAKMLLTVDRERLAEATKRKRVEEFIATTNRDALSLDTQRFQLAMDQAEIMRDMLALSPDMRMAIQDRFRGAMQQDSESRLSSRQDRRDDAREKSIPSANVNSRESYQYFASLMKRSDAAAKEQQKQMLVEQKRQTELLRELVNEVQEIEGVGVA